MMGIICPPWLQRAMAPQPPVPTGLCSAQLVRFSVAALRTSFFFYLYAIQPYACTAHVMREYVGVRCARKDCEGKKNSSSTWQNICLFILFLFLTRLQAKSLCIGHALSYLYQCNPQFNVYVQHILTQKSTLSSKNVSLFILINFLVRTLHCTETPILYLFCPFQNYRTFQYWRPAQNQPKFQILFHENNSPHDLYTTTWSARLLVQPPVVQYIPLCRIQPSLVAVSVQTR